MRSYNRFKTDQGITAIVDGVQTDVQLYNLSSGGCMIEIDAERAVEGATIEIVLSEKVAMSGQIAWRIDRNAGVKFDHPLHTAVISSYGFDEDAEFDRDEHMDRFGLPIDATMSASAGSMD